MSRAPCAGIFDYSFSQSAVRNCVSCVCLYVYVSIRHVEHVEVKDSRKEPSSSPLHLTLSMCVSVCVFKRLCKYGHIRAVALRWRSERTPGACLAVPRFGSWVSAAFPLRRIVDPLS